MSKFYKYKWMEKLDKFSEKLTTYALIVFVAGIFIFILVKYTIPYEQGKREFYEKEFYKNHPNY